MNGLDDLRGRFTNITMDMHTYLLIAAGWTLRGSIQNFIDVYVSQATFTEVERSFPYMVSREYSSGGGDVSENLMIRHPLIIYKPDS